MTKIAFLLIKKPFFKQIKIKKYILFLMTYFVSKKIYKRVLTKRKIFNILQVI